MVAAAEITIVVAATAATIMNTTMTMMIPVCDGIVTTIAEPITTTIATGGTPEAATTAGIGTPTVPGTPATHGIPAVPTGAQTGKKGKNNEKNSGKYVCNDGSGIHDRLWTGNIYVST